MLNRFKRFSAAILGALAAAIFCLTFPAVALAQRGGPTPPTVGHSDTMAYMLIIFCIALSMIVLCRGSNRRAEARLKDLDAD